MKLSSHFVLVFAVGLLPRFVLGQQDTARNPVGSAAAPSSPIAVDVQAANSPATNKADETSKVAVPSRITGEYVSLMAGQGDLRDASLISTGITATAFFEDNPLQSSHSRFNDLQYSVKPEIAVQQLRPRTQWNLRYAGGLTFDRGLDARESVTLALTSGIAYDLTRHVHLKLSQDYTLSSNPFAHYVDGQFSNTRNGNDMNEWAVTPTVSRSLLGGRGSLEWQLGPHSIIGFVASGVRSRFGHDGVGQGLLPTNSKSMRSYYARQVSRRHSVGVSVQSQFLRTFGVASHTRTHTAQVMYVLSSTPVAHDEIRTFYEPGRARSMRTIELTLYGGPEYTFTRFSEAPLITAMQAGGEHWFGAAGGSIVWRQNRFGMRVSYDQSTSDGGGLATAVRVRSVSAEVGADLSRRVRVSVFGGTGNNKSLHGTATSLIGFHTVRGGISIEDQLLRNVWLSLRYNHIHVARRTAATPREIVEHNGIEAAITYRFTRPWGR